VVPLKNVDMLENMLNSKNSYIDLNIPAIEEYLSEKRFDTRETSERKKFGRKWKVIKHLKEQSKQLRKQNDKLQKRMTKMVEKHNKICNFSRKLKKKNRKLYWTTRVLKTKWLQEKSKHKIIVQG
jgi:hypothetical protein